MLHLAKAQTRVSVPHNPALLAKDALTGTAGVAQTLLSVLLMLGTRVKPTRPDFFTNSEPPKAP